MNIHAAAKLICTIMQISVQLSRLSLQRHGEPNVAEGGVEISVPAISIQPAFIERNTGLHALWAFLCISL